jgi:hypothetical protein
MVQMLADDVKSTDVEAKPPRPEIEVTPEMIEAGESAIWNGLSGSVVHPSFDPSEMAIRVFWAMSCASRGFEWPC